MASAYTVKHAGPCVVPSNPMSSRQQHYIPSRKLEVLRDCVDYIFENKISEARKVYMTIYHTVWRMLLVKECKLYSNYNIPQVGNNYYCNLKHAVWHCCDNHLETTLPYCVKFANLKPSIGTSSFVFARQFLSPHKNLFDTQLMCQLTSHYYNFCWKLQLLQYYRKHVHVCQGIL